MDELDKAIKTMRIQSEPFTWKRIICWVFGHSVVTGYTAQGLPIFPVSSRIENADSYDRLPMSGLFFGTFKRGPDDAHICTRCGNKMYEFY